MRIRLILACIFFVIALASTALAAPYAAMVMDARTGKVLHARNADTRLHPASLTKMMTLYIAFEAIERGEISLDSKVTISRKAASEPPSRLGLKAGQKIALRYLIRAAAVKSANDAATAIAEAISGSEAAFARRMNRTAKALGMTRSTFRNAHGLTEAGHLSTARDMTILGRHLFYDYHQYYNLFSRAKTDAGVRTVTNTNRRLLSDYEGADGIKTGYTRAAGFNLVASAQRGTERIIVTVFGGRSSVTRNAKVAELLDLGFRRAPTRVAVRKPALPAYMGPKGTKPGKITRKVRAVARSIRPLPRPGGAEQPADVVVAAAAAAIEKAAIEEAVTAAALSAAPAPRALGAAAASPPPPRPIETATDMVVAAIDPEPEVEVVSRLSTSGGRNWGVNVGRYASRYQAERALLKTALVELSTLGEALRKVAHSPRGYDANFVGMTEQMAALACRRLQARDIECTTIGP